MKHHIMSFSGGFDSTLMVLNFLEELSKHPTEHTEDKLLLVSVIHASIGNVKNLKEYMAREKIYNICKELYPNIEIDHIKIDISINTTSTLKGNTGLGQPMLWISSIMPFMHEDDILYFGYVKEDSEILVHDAINKIVSGFTDIQYPNSSRSKHKIKVQYPLMHLSKQDVLYDLYTKNKEIFDICVTCESFDNDSHVCGKCNTCKNLKKALINLILDDDNDKVEFAMKYLNEWFGVRKDSSVFARNVIKNS